ncbi:BamA/TamA family outer membrane protein [Riemerella anatipestifer]|uniref:BamA/OMP85 family outer membrane protein n=1 Tax=Riemerella anatipestifer TaxID=34085 RepID=UPI0030BE59BC
MRYKFLPVLLFAASAHLFGQEVPKTNLQQGVQSESTTPVEDLQGNYILKDIVVDGIKKYSADQVLRFTGLRKGEQIEVPGQKISEAIKKLWNSKYFSEVEVYVQSVDGQNIVLRFLLEDLKELGEVKVVGVDKKVSKSKAEKIIKDNDLKPGVKITDDLINSVKHNIAKQQIDKGFSDARVSIKNTTNPKDSNMMDWTIEVQRGKRIKIDRITFEGNENISSRKLRKKAFKETKQKRFLLGILKSSKFVKEKYEEDKKNLVNYYNSLGYRDAVIVSDSIWRNKNNNYEINVKIDEGKKYYIGDINFIGNTAYSTEFLQKVLGYKKGDIYDAVGFNKKVGEDGGKEDDSDIKSLYLNNGYLFSQVAPVEKAIKGDSIDLEIRIKEGEKASWDRVTWSGNTTTHDHVILRSLQTRPGNLFSKRDLRGSYFDLAGMQFFDPQQIKYDIKPNPQNNTVDVAWSLVEKGSSQVQLQAGYGGNSFIGTLGLTFNNFSLRNFLRGKDFKPVPQGDGQVLSLQAQAGQFFQNYSFAFTEPWLFGSRPTALSISLNNSIVKYADLTGGSQRLNIFSANVGLTRRLLWPDYNFSLYTGISYQGYNFNNFPFQFGSEQVSNGSANNFAFNVSLSRNSAGFDPHFPTQGSNIEASVKFTPPYSLFSNKDYTTMSTAAKYNWLEFYKVKLRAETYNTVVGKLVLRSTAEMGFMDGYNRQLGAPPFERFYLGGVGLFAGRFDGRELIPLRGYQNASMTGGLTEDVTPTGGGTLYNRFAVELRYPISMNQTAKIYALTFAEGGNTWNSFSTYNPFQLKRSVGVGIRVFMGAFGLIGFDFAYGFDKTIGGTQPSGWNTHFLMNQPL